MPYPDFSGEEVAQLGEELYNHRIRAQVENHFKGKIVVIDIKTGDYEIGDTTLQGADRILANHPDAVLYSLRIGYDAVYQFGGSTLLLSPPCYKICLQTSSGQDIVIERKREESL